MQRGSFYLETMIALFVLTVIGTSLLPMYPQLLKQSREAKIRSNLVFLANYVGNYVYRWVGFSPAAKPIPFESYEDGVELESFLLADADLRVNQLFWADPLITENPEIDNFYKTSIQFFETDERQDSAVIRIQVWYDENANDRVDAGERAILFSTVITEKGLRL